MLFTGRAKLTTKCAACLSDKHTTDQCPASVGPLAQLMDHINQPARNDNRFSGGMVPRAPYGNQPRYQSTLQALQQPCGMYNSFAGPRCAFVTSKYLHIILCSSYRGDHPRLRCLSRTKQHPPQAKRLRLADTKCGQ